MPSKKHQKQEEGVQLLSFHTMGQPRPVNFIKDLPLPCDLQPVNVENQEEWDFCPDHEETETAEDSDTLASVLLSLNLKM